MQLHTICCAVNTGTAHHAMHPPPAAGLCTPQMLSLHRALAKGHQPALVSGIASDTAMLFVQAFRQMQMVARGETSMSASAAQGTTQGSVPADISKDDVSGWAKDTPVLAKLGAYAKYK